MNIENNVKPTTDILRKTSMNIEHDVNPTTVMLRKTSINIEHDVNSTTDKMRTKNHANDNLPFRKNKNS